MDPLRHPDLEEIGRRLRRRLEATLDADQHAAKAAMVRRSTIRDRLLEAEDRGLHAVVATADGLVHSGLVVGVGADHVVVDVEGGERFLALAHVVSLEVRGGVR